MLCIAKDLFIVAKEQSTDHCVCLRDDAVGLMVQGLPLWGLPTCNFLLEAVAPSPPPKFVHMHD
jgi:hypothetical protein